MKRKTRDGGTGENKEGGRVCMAETLKEYLVKVGFSVDHASYQAAMEAVEALRGALDALTEDSGQEAFSGIVQASDRLQARMKAAEDLIADRARNPNTERFLAGIGLEEPLLAEFAGGIDGVKAALQAVVERIGEYTGKNSAPGKAGTGQAPMETAREGNAELLAALAEMDAGQRRTNQSLEQLAKESAAALRQSQAEAAPIQHALEQVLGALRQWSASPLPAGNITEENRGKTAAEPANGLSHANFTASAFFEVQDAFTALNDTWSERWRQAPDSTGALDLIEKYGDQAADGLAESGEEMAKAGQEAGEAGGQGMADGLNNKQGDVQSAAQALADAASGALDGFVSSAQSAGAAGASAFVSAILAQVEAAAAASQALASAASGGLGGSAGDKGASGRTASSSSGIDYSGMRLPQAFGDGGFVDDATYAVVGEKGVREYIIPAENTQRSRSLVSAMFSDMGVPTYGSLFSGAVSRDTVNNTRVEAPVTMNVYGSDAASTAYAVNRLLERRLHHNMRGRIKV